MLDRSPEKTIGTWLLSALAAGFLALGVLPAAGRVEVERPLRYVRTGIQSSNRGAKSDDGHGATGADAACEPSISNRDDPARSDPPPCSPHRLAGALPEAFFAPALGIERGAAQPHAAPARSRLVATRSGRGPPAR